MQVKGKVKLKSTFFHANLDHENDVHLVDPDVNNYLGELLVVDIAVDKSSYMVLNKQKTALADIPIRYVEKFEELPLQVDELLMNMTEMFLRAKVGKK